MQAQTAIVILHFNKINLTRRCLQSVLEAGYSPDGIYCFDNGSEPDIFPQLKKEHPKCTHTRIPQNLGFSGGFNRSLEQVFSSGFTSALFLTNDTLLYPGAIEACIQTAQDTGAGMVAPKITFLYKSDAIDSIGAYFDTQTGMLHHYHDQDLPPLLNPQTDYIPGTALWINKETFETLGGTDESYHMYWEDVDLSFRGHNQGIIQARCYQAHVGHGGGQTTRKKPLYTTFYFHRNRIRFCRKYLEGHQREQVLQQIRTQLTQMGSIWTENNDHRRIGYLRELMMELED